MQFISYFFLITDETQCTETCDFRGSPNKSFNFRLHSVHKSLTECSPFTSPSRFLVRLFSAFAHHSPLISTQTIPFSVRLPFAMCALTVHTPFKQESRTFQGLYPYKNGVFRQIMRIADINFTLSMYILLPVFNENKILFHVTMYYNSKPNPHHQRIHAYVCI